jgi:hypothetical protein
MCVCVYKHTLCVYKHTRNTHVELHPSANDASLHRIIMLHFIALSHSTTNEILVPRSSHHIYHIFPSAHHHTASTHQSVVPKGHEALDNAGQRLSDRKHIIRDILVLGLLARVELVVLFHGRGRGRVRSPPDEHLVRAVLLYGLRLVKACGHREIVCVCVREREREKARERERERERARAIAICAVARAEACTCARVITRSRLLKWAGGALR